MYLPIIKRGGIIMKNKNSFKISMDVIEECLKECLDSCKKDSKKEKTSSVSRR
jgi:hypothetical protein